MATLEIRQLELGPLANFVYLLADAQAKKALVIDPAWDVPAIHKRLEAEGWALDGIFLTHNHFDHINGVGQVLAFADVPIYIHKEDAGPLDQDFRKSMRVLSGGESVPLGQLKLNFLHTPGHTEGSLCLKVDNHLVTGDTLFVRGCGRVDLPSSDPEKMYSSLKKIATLDGQVLVFPGHNYGPTPTAPLDQEKKDNPYMQLALNSTLKEFLRVIAP
ncbi:MAG: MBL fold metallo-hydrolase [Elusimicrobia bacterium]|nr:MBL fold metallo-hydrolase [Elusimicrobiota bacterium]